MRQRTIEILIAFIFSFLCVVTWIFVSCFTVHAKEVKKGAEIDIYFQDKYVESWSKEKFATIVKLADTYNEELKAEQKKKIKVVLKDDPWILIQNKKYNTTAKVIWYSGTNNKEDYKELKVMTIDISLTENPDNSWYAKFKRLYAEVSQPGCAIFFGLFLLFVLI